MTLTVVLGTAGAALFALLLLAADAWAKSPRRPVPVRPVKVKPVRPVKVRPVRPPRPVKVAKVTPAARPAPAAPVEAEGDLLIAAMPAPEPRPARGAHRPANARRPRVWPFRARRSPLPPMSVRCDLCARPWVGHDTTQCLRGAAMEHACPACGAPPGTACPTGWAGHQHRVDRVHAGSRWHWMYSTGGTVSEPCFCRAGRDHDEAGRAAR